MLHTGCEYGGVLQAYLAGMVFPNYVWITYSRNYTEVLSDTECDCNAQQFSEFMDGVFALTSTAVELGMNSSLTVIKEVALIPPKRTLNVDRQQKHAPTACPKFIAKLYKAEQTGLWLNFWVWKK